MSPPFSKAGRPVTPTEGVSETLFTEMLATGLTYWISIEEQYRSFQNGLKHFVV